MRRLEEVYPEKPMMPPEGTEARATAEAMLAGAGALSAAGFQYASSIRNESLIDLERQERRLIFEKKLDEFDAAIAASGGPFITGSELGLADAMYAPFLERWAVQLPLTSEFHLRPPPGSDAKPRWPRIESWFEAMQSVPAYATRVRGDAYSWSAAVATFQRIFSNGTLTPSQQTVIRRADNAALRELSRLRNDMMTEGVHPTAALAAAQVRRVPLDGSPI
mgnify:CR=1 FL=1|eukprot:scaffold175396_cov31-Tisochrysis_lutea.AAC.2